MKIVKNDSPSSLKNQLINQQQDKRIEMIYNGRLISWMKKQQQKMNKVIQATKFKFNQTIPSNLQMEKNNQKIRTSFFSFCTEGVHKLSLSKKKQIQKL